MRPDYIIKKGKDGRTETVLVTMTINQGMSLRRYVRQDGGYMSQALHERMDTCPQPRFLSEEELPEKVRNMFSSTSIEDLPVLKDEKIEIVVE